MVGGGIGAVVGGILLTGVVVLIQIRKLLTDDSTKKQADDEPRIGENIKKGKENVEQNWNSYGLQFLDNCHLYFSHLYIWKLYISTKILLSFVYRIPEFKIQNINLISTHSYPLYPIPNISAHKIGQILSLV